ncbi:A-kinase anchor protein 17A isoform X2 [Bactrocera dorsalis]|nr:A-kinase anchor protein 17A isoform X2 [Bactrocera dorsalis]
MTISVSLPVNKTGKSISHLDVMEKLSAALKPDKFFVLKASKSTIDFIRFEAELEDRTKLRSAISRIDGVSLRLSGFSESFRVRATETKDEFPTRHDWDSFFRDASNMDEMKAGERPDTIHLTHLPVRWFCPRHMENDDNVKPSESIFKRIFEKFGSVRYVDIPICDPYRNKMNADINGMKTFSYEHGVLFEAYVQFDEYMGFVRAMDDFRGMKLVRKFVDKTQAININVTFDKTKHLSDAQVQRRERVRKRLIQKAQSEEEEREKKKKEELEKQEQERQKEEQKKLAELEKQREREEKRKEKHLKKIQEKGQVEISQKIRIEERKLMIAQRKLESIRILEELFDRIKLKHEGKYSKLGVESNKMDLRDRLVEKYKMATEKLLTEQKKKVEEIKTKTPLMGLLKSSRPRRSESSDVDETKVKDKPIIPQSTTDAASAPAVPNVGLNPLNPFKAVAALAAAPGTLPTGYPPEAANEWMKSLSMFPYVPPVFGGMSALYRPPTAFPVSMNYRGYVPRIRGRGRGSRGRGRGGYETSYYNSYKNNYDDEQYDENDYRKESYSRSRNRSRSRSYTYSRSRSRKRHYSKRSRSRSRSPSRSRTRSRSRTPSRSRQRRSRSRTRSERRSHSRSYTRSRTRSRSHSKSKTRRTSHSRDESKTRKSRSRSRSKSPIQQRTNKKLVSTRRSYSTSESSRSRSKSRSRTHSKRSWSRRGERSPGKRHVVLEADKLVRSAEEMKRTIEKVTQDRMRQEEREIKENFRHCKTNSTRNVSNSGTIDGGNAIVTSSENDMKDTKYSENGDSNAELAANSIAPSKNKSQDAKRSRSRDRSRKYSHRSSGSRRNSYEHEADAY